MVSVEYSEAVVEVLGILDCLEENDRNKIPNNVLDFFEKNKSETYRPNIDYTADLKDLKLKDKTREIIAGLYIDYLCEEDEKEEYIEKLNQNEIKYQEKLKEKYNPDNIFKRTNNQEESNKEISGSNTALIEYKESLLNKIKRYILKLLHIDKRNF